MKCKNCNKLLNRIQKTFCSKSCSASFNNRNRIVSEKQKQKVSEILKNKHPKKYCKVCNSEITFKRYRKTCSDKCLNNLNKQRVPPKTPGGYRRGSGRGKHGWYEGVYFDSTYELAFYIYCKINNLNILRSKDKFKYINSLGEQRLYTPDFRVNGELVEIKGFVNKDTYLKLNSVNEPIKIMFKKDLQNIFKKVEEFTKLKIKDLFKLYTPDGARTRKPSE